MFARCGSCWAQNTHLAVKGTQQVVHGVHNSDLDVVLHSGQSRHSVQVSPS
jgi:hypothetical protein